MGSGDAFGKPAPASGSRGAATPIRSFRNSDGQWCREYRQVTMTAGGETLRHGIACRSHDGDWQARVIALDEIS
ncbi:MAG TPA: RT0821/Lpp0805 family surface protein [Kiloniellaceae bacterium]|nr:RT0821/Lpp0805 family surface protein [Kiloniellaceae bacterium]